MLAITLDDVRTIALAMTGISSVASLASAWAIKSVTKKVVIAGLFALIAIAFWSQRSAVTSCANDVASNVLKADTTCTFFGFDVTLPTG